MTRRCFPFERTKGDPLWRAYYLPDWQSKLRLEDRLITYRPPAWEWEPVLVSIARCRERRNGLSR